MIRTLQPKLKFDRYSQVHQLSRFNPLYLGILASRSRFVTKIIAMMQRRAIPPSSGQGPPTTKWDVVEEFWFRSEDVMTAALSSTEGLAVLNEMSGNLTGKVSASGLMMAKILTIADAPQLQSGSITNLFFLGRTSDLTREEMLRHWETSHAKLVLSLQRHLNFHAYDQLHAYDSPLLDEIAKNSNIGVVEYDGVADLMYLNQSIIGIGFLNPLTEIANFKLVGDEIHFIDSKHSVLVYGKRYIQ